jgi:hypothetical protein
MTYVYQGPTYYGDPGLGSLGAITTTNPVELTQILSARANAVRTAVDDTAYFAAHNRLFEAIAAAGNVQTQGRSGVATLPQWEAFTDMLSRARYTAENEPPPSRREPGNGNGNGNGEQAGLTRWILPAVGVSALVAALAYVGLRSPR